MTLDQLLEGQSARILSIHGQDAISVRLMEMGLIDGQHIRMIGLAPLGDPVEYQVRGYRISLRKAEAGRIEVEPR